MQNLIVSPAPHISKPLSTQRVMLDVVIALIPAVIAATVFFRIYALALIVLCVGSAMISEWICNIIRKKPNSLFDLSAVVTGLILALSLPPQLPYWAPIIGSAVAIIIGKMVFGGLGANTFNPAMVGRAFLTASFGILMTTWTVPATIDSEMPTVSPANETYITQATPLARSKDAIRAGQSAEATNQLLSRATMGEIPGCLGETSAIAILIGAIYLFWRKALSFHIPLAVLGSAFIFAAIFWLVNPGAYISPLTHLATGSIIFGTFFIATDPVTAPLTKSGMLIFGAGVGLLTMLIRIIGEYPEGFMFAILLMNAVTPLIDRFTKIKPAGGLPK